MLAHQLTKNEWKLQNRGFTTTKGRTVWKSATMDGDRRRVRISRKSEGRTFIRYVPPHTQMILVPKAAKK
jgi:hypothetical protein